MICTNENQTVELTLPIINNLKIKFIMKKTLLTILFLGATLFASAQTEISFVAGTGGEQTFTVGQQNTDDLGADIATITSATGSVATNNSFIGISSDDTEAATVTSGTFEFTLTTDSATSIDSNLTLDFGKRPGCTIEGVVSVTGYTDVPFSFITNGDSGNPVIEKEIDFGTVSLITGTDLTVTITLTSMTSVDNTANAIFRLENVIVDGPEVVVVPNQISYVATTGGEQTFTVGTDEADVLDADIATVTSSTGTVVTNASFIGVAAPATTDNDVTGTFVFTVTTDSATSIDKKLTLDIGKRKGISTVGTVSVTGYADVPFNLGSEGSATGTEGRLIEFGEISLITGTDLTVTVTLTSMTHVESTQTGVFRLENVILDDSVTLSNNLVSANQIEVGLSPNPVASNFTITANDVIKSVKLYSITGGLVKTFGAQASYNIADIASGVYFANIETAIGSKTIKVIKK